jgi:hypothetical protein
MSDSSPKFIAIDEQPDHHIVHALCLRKTGGVSNVDIDGNNIL